MPRNIMHGVLKGLLGVPIRKTRAPHRQVVRAMKSKLVPRMGQ